ncbi:MAG: DNA polymerase III subunit gamma/tau [Bacilli bacterium]|nr:DNA polymerase III subunit gamma/tau [Bacilli bacterium]
MYQALYRKYRPKTLDDVFGQETIVRIIKNSINSNEINHAYLFSGPRGTGKTSIAKIFAKIVNCENLNDCVPCGKCPSCKELNNNDIIEIDAASNNGVDEIRELRNKVNLVPTYGKYKIYIIDEVHMLTTGAFNALLKTLEEPPAHAIFILATTDPQKVPETILSRCQRFDFKKISEQAIVENLEKITKKEKIKIEKQALYEIARLADGGMRDSIGMLDQAKAYSKEKITVEDIHDINGTLKEEELSELIINLEEKNLDKILKETDKYNAKGKNFAKLIEELIYFIRNIILFEKAPEYFKTIHQENETYEKVLQKTNTKKLFHYIEILNKYSLEMKTTNNTKLMFELSLIQIIAETDDTEERIEIPKQKEPEKEISKPENTRLEAKEVEPKIDKKIAKEIEKIKDIRINNTLANFNRKKLLELKKEIDKVNELLLNPDYSKEASIILDGKLKAASDEYLIFVYKTERIANIFNENLLNIENTIEEALNKKYKLIATDNEMWEKIKDEFNNKKRKYNYQEEDFDLKEILKKATDEIEKEFEDIIEYK